MHDLPALLILKPQTQRHRQGSPAVALSRLWPFPHRTQPQPAPPPHARR